ncbi:MAG TPA: hypothetical protein DCL14_00620 [Ruminococcaceae bacterium]|nr:hypothetical protein [Oscillospiraceae bacterium]
MKKENDIACGWHLRRFSLIYEYFAFFDTSDYLSDSLFAKREIAIDFGPEYVNANIPYRVVFCRCRKRDIPRFLQAMEELPKKMVICGYSDYPKFCEKMKESCKSCHEIHSERRRGYGADDPAGKTKQKKTQGVL